jgi:hypothetical protein
VWILSAVLCSESWADIKTKEGAWPSFLPPPSQVPDADVVQDLWKNVTFQRVVEAPQLNVSMPIYESIIDAPDILAAAANHLGLTDESADPVPDGGFELRSPDGSIARYRVLVREQERRVILSQGTLVLSGVAVKAAVLGELKISMSNNLIHQNLTVFVRVKNPILSWFAHFVAYFLPKVADQELSRGFRLTHGVATWAASDPGEFCHWLASRPSTLRTVNLERALACSEHLQ